jgi:hypothetical protein
VGEGGGRVRGKKKQDASCVCRKDKREGSGRVKY